MAAALVGDRLWARIAPLLPKRRRSPRGGRPPVPDRAALTGILFVLRSGIPWEMLPQEMGCGSGMTCWRRGQGRRARYRGVRNNLFDLRRACAIQNLETIQRKAA